MTKNSKPALPPPPTPYEYALISKASYSDTLQKSIRFFRDKYVTEIFRLGWVVEEVFADEGYRGSLWSHPAKKQVVIAHRGSKNMESWITDLETVRNMKPGKFVENSIELLKHEKIKNLHLQGYRLSVTGHSLGGFLAQVTVYYSQLVNSSETYYPHVSAVIFDSPGGLEFLLEVLQPSISTNQTDIDISKLDIQNFCAMPTVISTYGTNIGTVWHIKNNELDDIYLASVRGHDLPYIIDAFNVETGYPKEYRRMWDWPKANYDYLNSLGHVAERVLVETVKLPCKCMNSVFKCGSKKVLKYEYRSESAFDQVMQSKSGEFTSFLRLNERYPLVTTENDVLFMHLKCGYVPAEVVGMKFNHFEPDIYQFIVELMSLNIRSPYLIAALTEHYGEIGYNMISKIVLNDKHSEINFVLDNEQSIFVFNNDLFTLLHEKGVFQVKTFNELQQHIVQNKVDVLEHDVKTIQQNVKSSYLVSNNHTSVPNVDFYIETENLVKARTYLSNQNTPVKKVIICGIAGSGKTVLGNELMKEYQLSHDKLTSFTRRLIAETEQQWYESIDDWFLDIATEKHKIALNKCTDKSAELTLISTTILDFVSKQSDWCILIDNWDQLYCKAPLQFISSVRMCGTGTLIVTSQADSSDLFTSANCKINLSNGFNQAESEKLFLSIVQQLSDVCDVSATTTTSIASIESLGSVNDLHKLLTMLNYLPLAVVQAGVYILWENKDRHKLYSPQPFTIFTYNDYNKLLTEKVDSLMQLTDSLISDKLDSNLELLKSSDDSLRKLKTQEAAIELSIIKATSGDPFLMAYLCCFGYLPSDRIPQKILSDLHIYFMTFSATFSYLSLINAYSLVQFSSVISAVDGKYCVHIHRVVQRVLRDIFVPKIMYLLPLIFEAGEYCYVVYTPMVESIQTLLNNYHANADNRNIVLEYIRFLEVIKSFSKPLDVDSKLFESSLILHRQLSSLKKCLHDYKSVCFVLSDVLPILKEKLSILPETKLRLLLTTMEIDYIVALDRLGYTQKAQNECKYISDILGYRIDVDNEQLETFDIMHLFNLTPEDQVKIARKQFAFVKAKNTENYALAVAQHNFADILSSNKLFEEAEQLFVKSIDIINVVCGEDSIDASTMHHSCGTMLKDYALINNNSTIKPTVAFSILLRSESHMRTALQIIYKRMEADMSFDDISHIASLESGLAVVLAMSGDADKNTEAIGLLRKALKRLVEFFGNDVHRDIAVVQRNLAHSLRRGGGDESEIKYLFTRAHYTESLLQSGAQAHLSEI